MQGLEIDYGLLAWDADLRYCDGGFDYFDCRGARWMHVNKEQGQRYLKNTYRVLLTGPGKGSSSSFLRVIRMMKRAGRNTMMVRMNT